MDPLHWPDQHHWQAAQGWLEMANGPEANEELDRIAPTLSAHPAVLARRWQLHTAAENGPKRLRAVFGPIKERAVGAGTWVGEMDLGASSVGRQARLPGSSSWIGGGKDREGLAGRA